ncbi:hypothetical protein H0H93_013261 [Arthromyces matolae]|nr:hypothetical protein H0H93_013261 [Arthromyces matolae]
MNVLYCSEKCQTTDWPAHKLQCGQGKTDRIDLKQFYPFLACLAEVGRFSRHKPGNPAQNHVILNNPVPTTEVCSLPDGSSANLVLLGEKAPQTPDLDPWWPSAATSPIRSKLYRRIQREGYLLPLLMAVSIGLLREMYTSTPEGPTGRRVRLRHGKSPIADFGIAKGKVRVTNQDRLAYFYLEDHTFELGQDPDEHYWFYFKTLSGQKLTLDVGMFTFNMCIAVLGEPYCKEIPTDFGIRPASAPAFFVDPQMAHFWTALATTFKECSILRNEELQKAVTSPEVDWKAVFNFMKELSGKPPTDVDKNIVKDVSSRSCRAMANVIQKRSYLSWPEDPDTPIERDPEEAKCPPGCRDDDQEWMKYAAKWHRRFNRGSISREDLREAIRKFVGRREKEAGQV